MRSAFACGTCRDRSRHEEEEEGVMVVTCWHVPSGAFKLVVILLFLSISCPIIEINKKKLVVSFRGKKDRGNHIDTCHERTSDERIRLRQPSLETSSLAIISRREEYNSSSVECKVES